MKRYLYENPRGFGNEFSIYAVEPKDMEDAKKIIDHYDSDQNGSAMFITRKEAEKMVSNERKNAKDIINAGMNLSNNPVGATEIIDFKYRYIE